MLRRFSQLATTLRHQSHFQKRERNHSSSWLGRERAAFRPRASCFCLPNKKVVEDPFREITRPASAGQNLAHYPWSGEGGNDPKQQRGQQHDSWEVRPGLLNTETDRHVLATLESLRRGGLRVRLCREGSLTGRPQTGVTNVAHYFHTSVPARRLKS